MELQRIDEGIWTAGAPLRFMGLQVNARMTVCRVADGLVLIGPLEAGEALRAAVDRLGTVRALVAPNLLHHLWLGDWATAYPDATTFGPAGLAAKRPDLRLDHALDEAFDEAFGAELERISIAGMPKLQESLFLHRPSETLIAADFCFYLPEARGLTGLFAAVTGVRKAARCEASFRFMIRDRAAFRASLSRLRSARIRHLSMCHDGVLSEGAQEAVQAVLDRLGVPAQAG